MRTPSRLALAARKKNRLCVGVLSGTSVDAAEAALCRIRGSGASAKVELLAHISAPFAQSMIGRVLTAESAREICALNFELGEHFARAVLKVIARAGLKPEQIDLIGSHGQTLAHLPRGLGATPSTLQIGEGAVIAERTGIPTVCDFRVGDVAAGGQGAPLVPYADWVMFRKRGVSRAFLNIGGIANVSVVGDALHDTLAFDTGPGNMLLDAFARRATGGRLWCDLDGALSRQGTPIPALLTQWLRLPFLKKAPPRSAGRESFGELLASPAWNRYRQRPKDLLATAVAFTVESIARSHHRYLAPRFELEAMYVSGGGVRNPTLMERLIERMAPLPVRPLDVLGFPEQAKEAACFALLASECLSHQPQNIPAVTGARRPVVLGKMIP